MSKKEVQYFSRETKQNMKNTLSKTLIPNISDLLGVEY